MDFGLTGQMQHTEKVSAGYLTSDHNCSDLKSNLISLFLIKVSSSMYYYYNLVVILMF